MNRKQRKLYLLIFTLLLLTATQVVYAQLKAVPDNVFVTPGARNVVWNILRNDNPGECEYESLKVTIIDPPKHAQTYGINTVNRVTYRPVAGFIGRDSLTYQISCKGGATSSAKVYININNKPDNMFVDVCHVPPPAIPFAMKLLSKTADNVLVNSPIVCGDIDNDGETEILVFRTVPNNIDPNSLGADAVNIYGVRKSNNQLYLKYTLTFDDLRPFADAGSIAIAAVDGDGYAAVFCLGDKGNDRSVIKFRYDPILKTYYKEWSNIYFTFSSGFDFRPTPLILDFAGDGNAQLQVFDKIYNAKTGTLLVDGIDSNGLGIPNYGAYGHAGIVATSFVSADIDGDGKPELMAGDCVYKVVITNHNGTAGNSYSILRRANRTGHAEVVDRFGGTAIADIDLDGELEVIVVAKSGFVGMGNSVLYIYRPQTGEVFNYGLYAPPAFAGQTSIFGVSRPFIGDMDGDGHPDISIVSTSRLTTYKYDPTNTQRPYVIVNGLETTDTSGSTTLTIFDFTQSGRSQLVYRDEDQLRILDGATLKDLATVDGVHSPTANEYPIVADVNGDGAAEIIVIGTDVKRVDDTWNWMGSLRIYASNGTPWAPARNVWDRGPYNPVNINDDLTVPRYPISPARTFTAADGKINRPYNNFLQQATMLNDEGSLLWLGSDLMFDKSRKTKMVYNSVTGAMDMTIFVGNVGDRDFSPSLRIGVYGYIAATDKYVRINIQNVATTVKVGEVNSINFSIPNYLNLISSLPAFDQWYICLNAKDNAGSVGSLGNRPVYYYGETECHSWNNNNTASLSFGERIMCEGKTEPVNISVTDPGTYLYKWYELTDPGVVIHQGDTYNVTKDASLLQRYLIDIYTPDGATKLNIRPDTVKIYLAPDSLVWTGFADNVDWHDYDNWYNPNSSLYPHTNIPRKCTDVLIPEGLEYYPDLSADNTNYEIYKASECANITFEHSSRVVRTDTLDYDAAYVHLRVSSNRNYMLSAPLQNFYTGDYYIKDRNPLQDDIIAYTSLYSRANPQTQHYEEAAWTGLFNRPDHLLGPGSGLRLWVDDKQPDPTVHSDFTFLFPKHDPVHSVFNKTTGGVVANYPVTRGKEHKFIYEPNLDISGTIKMDSVYAKSGNKKLLVGNPFMAYLDFNKFYQKNKSLIKSTYQVITADGSTVTYDAETGLGTEPTLDKYIAPMQSFWVESKSAFTSLYADVYMTSLLGTETLRSGGSGTEERILTIDLSGNGYANRTLLLYSPDAINLYNDDGEDITKIFMTAYPEAVSVYTCSSDGYYLDINRIGDLSEIVPIGIHTSLPGSYRLNFEGLWDFPSNVHVWLNEILPGGEIRSLNLSAGCHYYDFEKTDETIYMNNRFYLSFGKAPTDITQPVVKAEGIELMTTEGGFKIFTVDGSRLTKIDLYDLQGRKVNEAVPFGYEHDLQVESGHIYIIRAQSETSGRSFKVYAK